MGSRPRRPHRGGDDRTGRLRHRCRRPRSRQAPHRRWRRGRTASGSSRRTSALALGLVGLVLGVICSRPPTAGPAPATVSSARERRSCWARSPSSSVDSGPPSPPREPTPCPTGRCQDACAGPRDRPGARRVLGARALAPRARNGVWLDDRDGRLPSARRSQSRSARNPASAARSAPDPPALDVASAFPITPGSIGIGSGAGAVALAGRGIAMPQALGAGFAIQALETLVSISAGSMGALYLANEHVVVRRWTVRVAAVGGSAAIALVGYSCSTSVSRLEEQDAPS